MALYTFAAPAVLSYPHLFTPRASKPGDDPKYSATFLIPKGGVDHQNIERIQNEVRAQAAAPGGTWKGKNPPNASVVLIDGDGFKKNGDPYGAECHGKIIVRASTKTPCTCGVFENGALKTVNPMDIGAQAKFYAGAMVVPSIVIKAYENSGNYGITAYLSAVVWVADGEKLGDSTPDMNTLYAGLVSGQVAIPASHVGAQAPQFAPQAAQSYVPQAGFVPQASPAPQMNTAVPQGGFYGVPTQG